MTTSDNPPRVINGKPFDPDEIELDAVIEGLTRRKEIVADRGKRMSNIDWSGKGRRIEVLHATDEHDPYQADCKAPHSSSTHSEPFMSHGITGARSTWCRVAIAGNGWLLEKLVQ
jgi:hypothetical protein